MRRLQDCQVRVHSNVSTAAVWMVTALCILLEMQGN